MSMGGRWRVGLVGAGLALGLAGCDLAALADKLADDFERGIQDRAAEAVRNAQAKIGQNGGDVTTHSGAVAVPAGAIDGQEVEVAVAEVPPEMLAAPLPSALEPMTPPVAFTPHGTEFAEAVTLSLFYEMSVSTGNLHVIRLDNEQDTSWERVDPESVQFDGGVALVSTTHFSVYGVVKCDAAGKYADLCRQFATGELSFGELVKQAPPAEDAWGDVYQPPDSNTGGGDKPGGSTDERCPEWLEQCRPVYDTCSKDPAADICSRVGECLGYAEQCGIKLPPLPDDGIDGDPCAPIADACKAGDRAACDAYEQCLNTMPEPSDECLALANDCQHGNKDACTRFMQQCDMPPPPPPRTCEQLNTACRAGDENACATAVKQCGATTLDCADLAAKCEAGDLNACHAHDLNCNEEPPPPDDCEKLAMACGADDQLSCDLFSEQCTDPFPSQQECDDAFLLCLDDILDACTFWNEECSAHYPPPPDADCVTSHDACFGSGVSDAEACDAFFGSCPPSPEDCATLDSACMADNINACEAHGAYCGGGQQPDCLALWEQCDAGAGDQASCEEAKAYGCPPPPPPDGDPTGCGEVMWTICKTAENCGSAITCEGDRPPVDTDLQPVAGDFVHCDNMPVCPPDGGPCYENWSCVVNDAPPPDAQP